jgi:D-alanyl-D-alanine carboxypeptidase/D-alanyl-D-alanine-endopeptidase (penicillin-binding protein 4)
LRTVPDRSPLSQQAPARLASRIRRRRAPALAAAVLAALCAALCPQGVVRASGADREALRKSIDTLLSQPPLSSARVSAQIVSLDDGQVVYARSPDDQLNPASNTKLVTSAAALVRLGPEFRFTTDVLGDKSIERGRVRILYVKGRGDPSINTERLQGLVADLWHRGLRQVGDIVLDDSYFDPEPWGPGWEQEQSDKAYAAPVGALSLNHNSVAIYVAPADSRNGRVRIDLEPEARGYFALENRVATVGVNGRRRVIPHTFADGEHTRVVVSGRFPLRGEATVLYRRVTNPTFYFGQALQQLLRDHGIRVQGHLRRGTAPETAALINSYESPELAEVVRDMNKVSSNFIAEMLVKTLGAELRGVPGTWMKGLDVAQDLLAELGLPRGTYQLRNGSGLNDTNRFSAQQLTTLLVAVWKKFPVAAEFVSSLGIAARDGTMRLRMEGTDAAGRLRAKTGTLDKVTALSGYVQSLGGERFVFSILVNDWSGRSNPVVSGIDRFGGILAAMGGPEPSAREAVLLGFGPQPAQDAPPAELKARLATYAALSQRPDKKNLPFLRSALRTERDPLLRVVLAEALYRSDPDAGGGALLEAMPVSVDLWVRLRALGRELALQLPVVPSLLDLAAEGSGEALARILVVAPLARGAEHDEALEHVLSEGLIDVGDAAPDEIVSALRGAPQAQARAVVELIAIGLAQAGTDPQKFALAQALRDNAARGRIDPALSGQWLALLEHGGASPAPAPPAASAAVSASPPAAAKALGAATSGPPSPALVPASATTPAPSPAAGSPAPANPSKAAAARADSLALEACRATPSSAPCSPAPATAAATTPALPVSSASLAPGAAAAPTPSSSPVAAISAADDAGPSPARGDPPSGSSSASASAPVPAAGADAAAAPAATPQKKRSRRARVKLPVAAAASPPAMASPAAAAASTPAAGALQSRAPASAAAEVAPVVP